MDDRGNIQLSCELEVFQSFGFNPDTGVVSRLCGMRDMGMDTDVSVMPVEHLVDSLSDTLRDAQDYTSLYCVAHEFERLSEKLRVIAMQMEDSDMAVGSRYDVDLFALSDTEEGLPE